MCLPVFVVMQAFPSYGLVECMRVHVSACEVSACVSETVVRDLERN